MNSVCLNYRDIDISDMEALNYTYGIDNPGAFGIPIFWIVLGTLLVIVIGAACYFIVCFDRKRSKLVDDTEIPEFTSSDKVADNDEEEEDTVKQDKDEEQVFLNSGNDSDY